MGAQESTEEAPDGALSGSQWRVDLRFDILGLEFYHPRHYLVHSLGVLCRYVRSQWCVDPCFDIFGPEFGFAVLFCVGCTTFYSKINPGAEIP